MRKFFSRLIWQGLLFCGFALSANLPPPGSILPPPDATPDPSYSAPVYPQTRTDQVKAYRVERKQESPPLSNATDHPNEPLITSTTDTYKTLADIPEPNAFPAVAKPMSLREAIALSLRTNPGVQVAELQRIVDKFGLEASLQQYWIQWTPFTASSTVQNGTPPVWSAGSGIAYNAPTGTSVSIQHTNNLLGGTGSTVLTGTQQLLQGFGLQNGMVNYQNAVDNETIARLNFKNNVITDVIDVINAYNALVEAYSSLDVNKESLKDQEISVKQSKLQVQAGVMARSDLLQQQQNLETTRLGLVAQELSVETTYQAFLTQLGMQPTAKIVIDRHIQIAYQRIPSLQKCIELALKHNIAYQQAVISLGITKRALITAINNRKWTLTATSATTLGSQRSAPGQSISSLSTNPTLAFNLSVPIDQIALKAAVVDAQEAIETAKINLEQSKEALVGQVINQLQTIANQKEQITISELALKMQQQTLDNTNLKLKYGKTTVFEVNTMQNQLLQEQVSLINSQISYLNDVDALYQILGLTLEKWNIKLRY